MGLLIVQAITGVELPSDPLYDIQIKRIHEYKRQYLNILSLIWRYHQIKTATPEEKAKMVPRVSIFGGKAASAYYMAKKIVRLINQVGAVVNSDPDVGDLQKVCVLSSSTFFPTLPSWTCFPPYWMGQEVSCPDMDC